MTDPLSLVASCIAVAGLAAKVAKQLDDISTRWKNADSSLYSYQSQCSVLSASLDELAEWIKYQNYHVQPSTNFTRNLALSVEGCLRFLLSLKKELQVVGDSSSPLTTIDKLVLLWNETKIKDLQSHLNCQITGLMFLLQTRKLSQEQSITKSEREKDDVMRNVEKSVDDLRQRGSPQKPTTARQSNKLIKTKEVVEKPEKGDEYDIHLRFLEQTTRGGTDPAMQVLLADEERAECNRRIEEAKLIVPDCPLRVLVAGRVGVGKSTLCGKILDLPQSEAGISRSGTGTATSKVWDEIRLPRHAEHLVFHDSGGFQASGEEEMAEIKKFIVFRKNQAKVKDQLHCILYCIACEGERPIQTAEARFFSEVDTGQIPVFVVFTKYDKLIRSHLNDWEDENEDSKLNKSQREAIVEDPTFASFEKDFKGPLLAVAKRRTHIQICRTAVQKYHEVKLQKHNSKDLIGFADLTQAVAKALRDDEGGRLRTIWIASQRNRADLKLDASLTNNIDQYWKVQRMSKIPIIPLICVLSINDAYCHIIKNLNQLWNLETEPPTLLTEDNMAYAFGFFASIFDKSDLRLFGNAATLATANFGGLQGSITAKIMLKLIVGLSLIYERLFLSQQNVGDQAQPLTYKEIAAEARSFKASEARKHMADTIEKNMTFGKCYDLDAARLAARLSLKAGKTDFGKRYAKAQFAVWDALGKEEEELPLLKNVG